MLQRFVLFGAAILSIAAITKADDLLVKGVVSDAADGAAIVGATVQVSINGTEVNPAVTTDENGEYTFTTTADASNWGIALVSVSVSATGYTDGTAYGVVSTPADEVPDTVELDVELTESGGQQPGADSLYVSGNVTNSDGNAVEGAMVTVRLGWGGANISTLTDASGDYSVALLNETGRRMVTLAVAADGYSPQQQQAEIANPTDGEADIIEQDFVLESIPMDTVTVTATVVDDADEQPLAGAKVIVSYLTWQGMGMQTFVDTGMADADGNVAFNVMVPSLQSGAALNWVTEADGYASEQGSDPVINDSVNIGTVRMTELTAGQNITYIVSGRVSGQNGAGIGNAEVIVVIEQDGGEIFSDTTTTSRFLGDYSVSTQQDYAAGDITVTVSVTADGYEPASVTQTPSSSTSDITIDVVMLPEGTTVVWKPAVGNLSAVKSGIRLIGMNGRILGTVSSDEASIRNIVRALGFASQPVILFSKEINLNRIIITRP